MRELEELHENLREIIAESQMYFHLLCYCLQSSLTNLIHVNTQHTVHLFGMGNVVSRNNRNSRLKRTSLVIGLFLLKS